MKRADKEQLVSELKTQIEGAKALYYTDFTGLNVKRMTELRRRFRKAGVQYVVIKNTLALRAVNESGLVGERLKGPTGLVMAADPVEAAAQRVRSACAGDASEERRGEGGDGADGPAPRGEEATRLRPQLRTCHANSQEDRRRTGHRRVQRLQPEDGARVADAAAPEG